MSGDTFASLLERVLDITWEDLSSNTIERAEWIILDTMFVARYGVNSPEIKKYIDVVGSHHKHGENHIPIIGTDFYTTPYHSAQIYGTAIVSNELDEGNQFAKGHPAAHIFPPAFISAIENNVTGKEFLRAFTLGYEASSRLAYASNMDDDMHPHGTWGIVGGVIAAGILQNKDKNEIMEATYIAASLPLATSWQSAVTGMTVRNLYAGIGCWQALQALFFQSMGFRSSPEVAEHLWGNIMSDGMNVNLLLKDLWSPPLLDKNYFKLYPSCRFSHSAIDAFLPLMNDKNIDMTKIKAIEVKTYNLAARLDNPDPQNLLAARFSIPFLLSVLLNGFSLFDLNQESVFSNPSIRTYARTFQIIADEEMNKLLPHKRAARVTVIMEDGTKTTSYVDDASGGSDKPLPKKELVEKYQHMFFDRSGVGINSIVEATERLTYFKYFQEWVDGLEPKKEA